MQNIQTNPLLWSKWPFKVCLPKVGNIFKVKQNLCLANKVLKFGITLYVHYMKFVCRYTTLLLPFIEWDTMSSKQQR